MAKLTGLFFCVFHVKQVEQRRIRIICFPAYPCDGYEQDTCQEEASQKGGTRKETGQAKARRVCAGHRL
jgi:hypothetical protein